ncbi:MAG TPA: hypothetical protein VF661_04610 [Actinomycetales bacterium]|jgi:hypothetical protein
MAPAAARGAAARAAAPLLAALAWSSLLLAQSPHAGGAAWAVAAIAVAAAVAGAAAARAVSGSLAATVPVTGALMACEHRADVRVPRQRDPRTAGRPMPRAPGRVRTP